MIEPTCQIKGLEEIYGKHLPDWGFFVEIGAYDGKTYSNTYHLSKKGWAGIYVEPIQHLYQKCVENHQHNGEIDVWPIAISDYNGELTLYDGPEIYSASDKYADYMKRVVPCLTLDTFLRQTFVPIPYSDLDLLVIDVEFHEKEVLSGFTLKKWFPKMVIIEAHEHHENEKYRLNVDFINDYFKDYKKVYSDHINNIYVRD